MYHFVTESEIQLNFNQNKKKEISPPLVSYFQSLVYLRVLFIPRAIAFLNVCNNFKYIYV